MKTINIKWRKYGTNVTLARPGRPSKMDDKTRRKAVRDVAKSPTATLRERQEFLSMSMRDYGVGWQDRGPIVQRKTPMSGSILQKDIWNLPKNVWGKCVMMKPRLNFLDIIPEAIFVAKTTLHITKSTPLEAWWWPRPALFLFSWNWGLGQGWREDYVPNTNQCWHKTFGLLLESWKWRGTLSTTMTQILTQHDNDSTKQ